MDSSQRAIIFCVIISWIIDGCRGLLSNFRLDHEDLQLGIHFPFLRSRWLDLVRSMELFCLRYTSETSTNQSDRAELHSREARIVVEFAGDENKASDSLEGDSDVEAPVDKHDRTVRWGLGTFHDSNSGAVLLPLHPRLVVNGCWNLLGPSTLAANHNGTRCVSSLRLFIAQRQNVEKQCEKSWNFDCVHRQWIIRSWTGLFRMQCCYGLRLHYSSHRKSRRCIFRSSSQYH